MRPLLWLITSLLILNVSTLFADSKTNEFPYIQPISVEFMKTSSNANALDSDNDGVSNDKDKCANTPSNTIVDIFGCKMLLDDDKDGISNRNDKCPKSQEGATVDSTGCEPDADKDGVMDLLDECPNTSEDFVVDKAGCPQTAILKVAFSSASSKILPQSQVKIEKFANFLLDNEAYQAIIYGYTDNSGSESKNKELSRKRARSVMNALIKYDIKLTRLTAIGMGSKNAIASNETPEGRAKNRRIEVELLQ